MLLSAAPAFAESNDLAATETPQGPEDVMSSAASNEASSEPIPVFRDATLETENGAVARDVNSEEDPVFNNELPRPAQHVMHTAQPAR